ncbi:MAG: helix-turn-helix domain-containing protein, partial [Pseudomonadota bacterium]
MTPPVAAVDELDPMTAALERMRIELEKMHPNGASSSEAGWQERKSGQTRLALLDAAVKCLSMSGYARTTTQLVAASAKISRGAMLHHYATKADL